MNLHLHHRILLLQVTLALPNSRVRIAWQRLLVLLVDGQCCTFSGERRRGEVLSSNRRRTTDFFKKKVGQPFEVQDYLKPTNLHDSSVFPNSRSFFVEIKCVGKRNLHVILELF